jgi:GT2 family glycosyltransferase
MDVSIIIINYNTINYTLEAIDSVFEKTEGIEYEIIVVDNNSSDNSKEIIARRYDGRVAYHALPENIGFGMANNEGAKIARGRNLFLLNSDTKLINNAVKILADYLDENPKAGCCGANLMNKEGKPIPTYMKYKRPSIFDEINAICHYLPEKIIFGKNANHNFTNKPVKTAEGHGAAFMIKKKLFIELNGFCPDFFMYGEDVDLQIRLRKAGYCNMNIPCAQVIHLCGKSSASDFKTQYMMIGRFLNMKKHCNFFQRFVMDGIIVMNIMAHLIVWGILNNKNKIEMWKKYFALYKNGKKNSQ